MPQTITLTLPDDLYEPIHRIAQATARPVETVLLSALQTSLPSLAGLPSDLIEELIALETLDNPTLQQILLEMAPSNQQADLEELLQRNQAGILTDNDQDQLNVL